MLEFKIIIDTEDDIVTVTGPTNLVVEEQVWSIEDMCEVFKHYMLEFCKKVHFGDYRIDAIGEKYYSLSKDIQGTRSEWIEIGKFSTYFDAYEALCDAQYADSICSAGYTDCIWNKDTDYYNKERCKECAAKDGCYYDDEDK